jgi:tetratricopeptide (TPR) repeat protein
LSRRDRKARHLKVAAHLRAVFTDDGEEVADVIAQHYLDALHAISGDPDAAQIRRQAIAALIRAAERAIRTGAPARAAASYAAAAGLSSPDTAGQGTAGSPAREPAVGVLWERAADAAVDSGDYATAIEHAGRARDHYAGQGQARAAARAQAITGQALRLLARHAEAREQLTAAVEVLRADPDADTVRALDDLAALEVFDGSADADRLSTEAIVLGQALDVAARRMCSLLVTRGIHLTFADRPTEAVAYLRESARLATEAGDNFSAGRALLNLSAALTDPASQAEAARTAAGHLRRVGNRDFLAYAITNLSDSLISLGDWDAAEAELTQANAAGELAGYELIDIQRAELAALRGDAATAETILTGLRDLRASEDAQDKAFISRVEALAAAARGRPRDTLRHARDALAQAGVVGIGYLTWEWALAARAAYEVRDTAATQELLALAGSSQPRHLPPVLRAERDLARARLAGQDGDPEAKAALGSAVSGLRELSTPYHLAHGLLDYAAYLTRLGDADAAAAAVQEARDIARRLRCRPLLDRADAIEHAASPTRT